MLLQGAGEVQLRAFGTRRAEIQVVFRHIRLVRVERRVDGIRARRANRAKRQPRHLIGVVEAVKRQITARQRHFPYARDVVNRHVALQLHARFQAVVEHGGHLREIRLGRFLLNHARQRQNLVHRVAHLFRAILTSDGEHPLGLRNQLADDFACRRADVDFVGVGREIPLQHIAALADVPAVQHVLHGVKFAEARAALAQGQELRAVRQHAVFDQLLGKLLNRPAGNERDIAHNRVAVAARELVGNLPHGHRRAERVAAGLNFLPPAREVAVVLEHRAIANQPGFLQPVRHAGQALSALDGEGHLRRAVFIRRRNELAVHLVPHAEQDARHNQHRAQANQDWADDAPQRAVPVRAISPLVADALVAVMLLAQQACPPWKIRNSEII